MPFSHTDTGDKNPDPYRGKSKDEVSLEEKVTGLSNFISERKFAMMTTRDGKSGMLTSRCMGLAAKVCIPRRPLPFPHPGVQDRI